MKGQEGGPGHSRYHCNCLEDLDINYVSTNSSSSISNEDSNDNNNILAITDGESDNTDNVDYAVNNSN